MEIISVLAVCASNAFCFALGAMIGQRVMRGEKIEMPKPSMPSLSRQDAIRDRAEREQAERERERLEVIMANIEAYDGTSYGQRDVPRG